MANYDIQIKSWNPVTKVLGAYAQHRIVIQVGSRLRIAPEWEGITDPQGLGPGMRIIYRLNGNSLAVSNSDQLQVAFKRKGLTDTSIEVPSLPGFSLDSNGGTGHIVNIDESKLDAALAAATGFTTVANTFELSRLEGFNKLMDELYSQQGIDNGTSGMKDVFTYSIASGVVSEVFQIPCTFAWEITHPSISLATDGQIEIFPLNGSVLDNYEFKLDADSYAAISGDSHVISGIGAGTYNLRIRDVDNPSAAFTSKNVDLELIDP